MIGKSTSLINLVSAGPPNHKVVGIDITIDNKYLILLTVSGYLNIWNLENLTLKQRFFFDECCVDFKLLKFSCKLMICTSYQLKIFDLNNLVEEEQMTKKFRDAIGFSRLSFNEELVAVCFPINEEKDSSIFIFKIELNIKEFVLLKKFENFKSNITIMDFSINNVHFLYKENSDMAKVFNLMAKKFENDLNIHKNENIDWIEDGLLVSQDHDVKLISLLNHIMQVMLKSPRL